MQKASVTFADVVKHRQAEENGQEKSSVPTAFISDDEIEDGEDDLAEFSDSVYFSLARTPPSSDMSMMSQDPMSSDDTTKDEEGIVNGGNSFDISACNQSELDMASVSALIHGPGHEESLATLMNVSSCNNSTIQEEPSSTSINLPEQNLDIKGGGDCRHLVDVDDDAADEEVHKINANLLLPSTVTELVASNGVKVYVVGTAHFSEQSQKDVKETIQKLQPTLVVLELCHSRRNILTLDEETILRESADMSLGKVKEAINQSGAVQGTLHLLLLSMSAQLTKKLGMAPGGEFRAAVQEARNIPGCLLLLGDRPFKVTLSRALAALSLGQKIKLAWQFLTSNEDITKDEIERCKEKDLLERMMMEMTGEFPAISRVFVNERDTYLAHSLWLAATSTSHPNHGGPIVGVVGMGHIAGIIRTWGKTTEEQIAELISIPERTMLSTVVRATIKVTFYALLGYGAFKLSRRVFDFPPPDFVQSTWKRLPQITSKSLSHLNSR